MVHWRFVLGLWTAVFAALLCAFEVEADQASERAALCEFWKHLKPKAWVDAGFEPCRTDVDICQEGRTVNCNDNHLIDSMFVVIVMDGYMC